MDYGHYGEGGCMSARYVGTSHVLSTRACRAPFAWCHVDLYITLSLESMQVSRQAPTKGVNR